MIYSEHYYGGSEVWSAEEITQVKTAKHNTGNSEHSNFETNTSILNGKLRLGKLLGRGAFGEVYEAYTMGSGITWHKVAVKKIRGEFQYEHLCLKDIFLHNFGSNSFSNTSRMMTSSRMQNSLFYYSI